MRPRALKRAHMRGTSTFSFNTLTLGGSEHTLRERMKFRLFFKKVDIFKQIPTLSRYNVFNLSTQEL